MLSRSSIAEEFAVVVNCPRFLRWGGDLITCII